MPLTYLRPGESRLILRISGRDEQRARLAALGFVPGEKMTVLSVRGQDLIILIKDSRVALGQALAARIHV